MSTAIRAGLWAAKTLISDHPRWTSSASTSVWWDDVMCARMRWYHGKASSVKASSQHCSESGPSPRASCCLDLLVTVYTRYSPKCSLISARTSSGRSRASSGAFGILAARGSEFFGRHVTTQSTDRRACMLGWVEKAECRLGGGCLSSTSLLRYRVFYLNAWECERARARIEEEWRKTVGKWDWYVFYRIFGPWQVYAFTVGYTIWTLTSMEQINSIPTAISAVNWFVMVSTGFIIDIIGRRGPLCFAVGCVLVFTYAVLTVWDVGHPFCMAVFILRGVYECYTPILAGSVNEACGGDQQKRAFVLAFMVSVGQAVGIAFQQLQLQFPSSDAPCFSNTHVWGFSLAFVTPLTLWTGVETTPTLSCKILLKHEQAMCLRTLECANTLTLKHTFCALIFGSWKMLRMSLRLLDRFVGKCMLKWPPTHAQSL
ncbi:uncharacterized protein MYCFIDRAFT_207199 [Pseudocercospora fijiensis CIRAD86]|uniref:Major facilitator superfamily (MFS) profile domain-containing protein n=1 Tax=Pseudocercospora fijiensis (strain CIRAD86) TaxID=383855 RepID=M2ZZ49_PSEFD|nr:uncharacterized protein MYCFIDRAFT_207199 [Pseudocercospora fijiensis CIRAD86]EME84199.1 hypothetical protein MYCFIDRAFT_207199 [Pseudocercospora fijiensis CIRAD86]